MSADLEVPIDPPIIVRKDFTVVNGHHRLSVLKQIYPNATLLIRPTHFGEVYEAFALKIAIDCKKEK